MFNGIHKAFLGQIKIMCVYGNMLEKKINRVGRDIYIFFLIYLYFAHDSHNMVCLKVLIEWQMV